MKRMGSPVPVALVAAALLAAAAVGVGGAKKVFPEDRGPSRIDVSRYPAEMQDIYSQRFSKRCSKCHTLARPINTKRVVLEDEWETYTKKMMRKPGSGIRDSERRQIVKFLIHDGRVRKSSTYLSKLDEAIKAERDPGRKQMLVQEREEVLLRIRVQELEVQARAEKSAAKKGEYQQEADRLRAQADQMMYAREKTGQ